MLKPLIPEAELALERAPSCAQRPPLDFVDGCPRERLAQAVSPVPDRLLPVPTQGLPGGVERLLAALARDLEERGSLDVPEGFIDSRFGVAKEGVGWERLRGAKARSGWPGPNTRVLRSLDVSPGLAQVKGPGSSPPWRRAC